jgi:signal transduction histidine kinase
MSKKSESKVERRKGSLLLSSLSHGLRTPLNGIISYNQLLLQTEVTELQQSYLHSMNTCCLELMELLNDILDYSRLCMGKISVNIEKFNIQSVIDVVKGTLNSILSDKKQTCRYVVSRNLPKYIVSDKKKIVQILINVISNASKFSGMGGYIAIHISPKTHDTLEFTVHDNGIGISDKNQEMIFDAFYQMTDKKGFGLGLTISKQLVDLLGGEIRVSSREGCGSTISFTITNINAKLNKEIKMYSGLSLK